MNIGNVYNESREDLKSFLVKKEKSKSHRTLWHHYYTQLKLSGPNLKSSNQLPI